MRKFLKKLSRVSFCWTYFMFRKGQYTWLMRTRIEIWSVFCGILMLLSDSDLFICMKSAREEEERSWTVQGLGCLTAKKLKISWLVQFDRNCDVCTINFGIETPIERQMKHARNEENHISFNLHDLCDGSIELACSSNLRRCSCVVL